MRDHALWRAPDLSLRWWPVFLRNLLVWRKLAIPSVLANIAEPLIWLIAFGYGMGALIGQVPLGDTQVPYLVFLASGSICMSAMNAASFEALYSAFSRMHVQKTWSGILNTPVSLDNVVVAEMLWAAYKAVFTVTAILIVMVALGISTSPKLAVAWLVLAGAGIAFASIALIFNALAKGYDFFNYYFTLFLTGRLRLAAPDQCCRTGATPVHGPLARGAAAPSGGAGGLCRGGFLAGLGPDASALSKLMRAAGETIPAWPIPRTPTTPSHRMRYSTPWRPSACGATAA